MLRIAVIDGQGGGIGSLVVKRLKEEFSDRIEMIALGTNAAATTSMMKSMWSSAVIRTMLITA